MTPRPSLMTPRPPLITPRPPLITPRPPLMTPRASPETTNGRIAFSNSLMRLRLGCFFDCGLFSLRKNIFCLLRESNIHCVPKEHPVYSKHDKQEFPGSEGASC